MATWARLCPSASCPTGTNSQGWTFPWGFADSQWLLEEGKTFSSVVLWLERCQCFYKQSSWKLMWDQLGKRKKNERFWAVGAGNGGCPRHVLSTSSKRRFHFILSWVEFPTSYHSTFWLSVSYKPAINITTWIQQYLNGKTNNYLGNRIFNFIKLLIKSLNVFR